MRRWLMLAVTVCTILALARPLAAAEESSDPTGASESVQAEQAPPAVADATPAPGRGAQVLHNFQLLARNSLKEWAAFVGSVIGGGILWGLLLGLAGLLLGLIAYLLLRRWGAFRMPFRSSGYVTWLWAPIFTLIPLLGLAYAGVWFGAGRAFNRGISEQRLIERTLSNFYCAVAFDAVKYELSGKETAEEIQATLHQSEKLSAVLVEHLGTLVKDATNSESVGGRLTPAQRQAVQSVSNSRLGSLALDHVARKDPAMIVLAFCFLAAGDERVHQFAQENPRANVAVAVVTHYTGEVREQCCRWVRATVYLHSALGIGVATGIPLGLLGMVRLILWVFVRRKVPAAPVV